MGRVILEGMSGPGRFPGHRETRLGFVSIRAWLPRWHELFPSMWAFRAGGILAIRSAAGVMAADFPVMRVPARRSPLRPFFSYLLYSIVKIPCGGFSPLHPTTDIFFAFDGGHPKIFLYFF